MTNHLADELRQILDDFDEGHRVAAHGRLLRLAEHVERLGADPVEVDASTELTASFGLEPEQEIRSRGLEAAAELLAPVLGGMSLAGVEANRDNITRLWLELAQHGEALIATGGACDCTVVDDPECPLHGGEPRRRSTDR